jgi:hypothetical protein
MAQISGSDIVVGLYEETTFGEDPDTPSGVSGVLQLAERGRQPEQH